MATNLTRRRFLGAGTGVAAAVATSTLAASGAETDAAVKLVGVCCSPRTGKTTAHKYLRSLGAAEILPREAVDDTSGKPLLSRRWAGAVDNVGGNALSTVLRSTQLSGCVAACGNAAGFDLPITVYPFILRGVTLAGIDAAWCPIPLRHETWHRLAGEWKLDCLDRIARFIDFCELPPQFDEILAGRLTGRLAIEIAGQWAEAGG